MITIPAIVGVMSLSGCFNLGALTGPTPAQMQAMTSSCQHQLGLSSDVQPSQSAKLSDCMNRSLIAAGFAEPEPIQSSYERRIASAQENAQIMNRFCPVGAAVLYSGSTYCVGRR
jgi:hypothetical protein